MKSVLRTEASPSLLGKTHVPGDKSISHRALMLASLAKGKSQIRGFLNGNDCMATSQVMQQLGANIRFESAHWVVVEGTGHHGLQKPRAALNCQNSGTTMRLLAGLLAGQKFQCTLTGSEQLKTRPMDRIIEPLKLMGAKISAQKQDRFAPINILAGNGLQGITYRPKVSSAQINSCLLLAGLFAKGRTVIEDPGVSRDHTERMLESMGAKIHALDHCVEIEPLDEPLRPIDIMVPGDISSAAFLLVAAAIIPHSHIVIENVGLNPTRIGICNALRKMGAEIDHSHLKEEGFEPVGDIVVKHAPLQGATFGGEQVVKMIDELPILAVAATQASGTTIIKDAAELKVKETNRIDTTVSELSKLGANIKATEDGFEIQGPTQLKGTKVDSHGDHRLAMALAVAGLIAEGTTTIANAQVTHDSFPGFADSLKNLGAKIQEG